MDYKGIRGFNNAGAYGDSPPRWLSRVLPAFSLLTWSKVHRHSRTDKAGRFIITTTSLKSLQSPYIILIQSPSLFEKLLARHMYRVHIMLALEVNNMDQNEKAFQKQAGRHGHLNKTCSAGP